MSKYLFSWIAFNHDFTKEDQTKVKEDGTTASFHEHFYEDYEEHIILSAAKGDDTRMEFLLNFLNRKYPTHKVSSQYMSVDDIIDMEQIRSKIEPLLFEYQDHEIDLFISPGTPAMHSSWILAHNALGLKTNLLQVRPIQHTKNKKKPELIRVEIEKDSSTSSVIIKDAQSKKQKKDQPFFLSSSIKPIYTKADKIAQAPNSTVLIIGETGTGKEHLANRIHKNSPRREKPFISINCAALHDQLLESRLFGYQKGAFTGAEKDTQGLIELAEGGTVFLDEIGDVSPYMQQTLLRVLQEKEIQPIGGKSRRVDVRFVSATNNDLIKKCEAGKFRWDLYYRLAVVDIELPTLVERGQKEIKQLIDFFLKEKKKLFNTPKALKLPKEMMELLLSYPFPGNIRELENLIERLYVLQQDMVITLADLPLRIRNSTKDDPLLLSTAEKKHIAFVLKFNKGKQRKTARDLDIAYNTLMKKIGEYGIEL